MWAQNWSERGDERTFLPQSGSLVIQAVASHATHSGVRRLEHKASHPPGGSADVKNDFSSFSTSWLGT
jgi:hypothetical protein